MAKGNNSPLQERWTGPSLGLVLVQVMMVSALILIVRTPWYGEFFYLRMRGMLIGVSRSTGNIQGLKQALSYSKASSRKVYEDLDVIDEIAMRSPLKNASDWAKRMDTWTSDKTMPEVVRDIAVEKTFREELRIARLSILAKDINAASDALEKASQLIALPYKSEYSRLVQVKRYLSLSASLSQLKGDKQRAASLHSDLEQLKDPSFAKDYYERNKISGYNSDYSQIYIAQCLMLNSEKEDNWQKKSAYLRKAIDICNQKIIPHSLRVGILLNADWAGIRYKDESIRKLTFESWYANDSNQIPASSEEGSLIATVLGTALSEGNQTKTLKILARTLDCIDQKRYPAQHVKAILTQFSNYLSTSQLFNPNVISAPEQLKLCKHAIEIAHRLKIDDTSIQFGKIPALIKLGKLDEARKLFLELIRRPSSYHPDITGINFLGPLLAQFTTYLSQDESPAIAYEFLEEVFKSGTWTNPDLLATIVLIKIDKEQELGKDTTESLACLNGLLKTKKLNSSNQILVPRTVLRIQSLNMKPLSSSH